MTTFSKQSKSLGQLAKLVIDDLLARHEYNVVHELLLSSGLSKLVPQKHNIAPICIEGGFSSGLMMNDVEKKAKYIEDITTVDSNVIDLMYTTRTDEALQLVKVFIKLRPNWIDLYFLCGHLLNIATKIRPANNCYRLMYAANIENVDVTYNLAVILMEAGDWELAIEVYLRVLKMDALHINSRINLAVIYRWIGELEKSRNILEQCLYKEPENTLAKGNLAVTLLKSSDYKEGLRHFEYRYRSDQEARNILGFLPKGRRKTLHGEDNAQPLIIVAEQGLGDSLMFSRYLQLIKERGIQFRVCAPKSLHDLFNISGLKVDLITPEDLIRHTGYQWLPMMSLPYHYSLEAPYALDGPYLRTTDELINLWTQRLRISHHSLIAINWQGNKAAETGDLANRSLELTDLNAFGKLDSFRLVSVQKGICPNELYKSRLASVLHSNQQLVDQDNNLLDTAAILKAVDLVVTCDTSVAHLAGSLGCKTFLLLHETSDWRWGVNSSKTPWYKTVTLYRQKRREKWNSVVERLVADLSSYPSNASHSSAT